MRAHRRWLLAALGNELRDLTIRVWDVPGGSAP